MIWTRLPALFITGVLIFGAFLNQEIKLSTRASNPHSHERIPAVQSLPV